jgi:hypothetical protein
MGGIMKKLFNNPMFTIVIVVLSIALIIKILWLTVDIIWLEDNEINDKKNLNNTTIKYYRVTLAKNKNNQVAESGDIKMFKLLGFYKTDDILLVAVEKNSKSIILQKGDDISGYELVGVSDKEAVFRKNDKEYRLKFLTSKGGI